MLYDASGKAVYTEPVGAKGGSQPQTSAAFPIYQQFANTVKAAQSQFYPGLDKLLAWGKIGARLDRMDARIEHLVDRKPNQPR